MTFKEVCEKFPIGKTIIGNYGSDQVFTITNVEQVEKIKNSVNAPLEWTQDWSDYEGVYPFIVYDGQKQFTCWYFSGLFVNGYLNETDDPEEFYPATYSEDFGWELFDPNNKDNYNMTFFVPSKETELRQNLTAIERIPEKFWGHKWNNEIAAYYFDSEKYMDNMIFTTYTQLENFIRSKNFNEMNE